MSSLVPQRALGRWAYTMGVPAMQFRIALRDVAPEVWRRVELLSHGSFWDLHVALNTAMGWQDSHLHEFVLKHPITGEAARIGIPDPEGFDDHEVLPGWQVPLSEFLRTTGFVFEYHYDFGDGWIHDVCFESLLPRGDRRVSYPRLTGGERACPPEDCGGPWGYTRLLEALADPQDPEHRALKRWAPRGFDPARFKREKVKFEDAEMRLFRLLRER